MSRRPAHRADTLRRGTTLIELLVVISIIMALAAVTLSVTMLVGGKSRATVCRNNIRQVLVGLLHYSKQWGERFPGYWGGYIVVKKGGADYHLPAPERPGFGDDDLSPLYALDYVTDLRVFNCPSTTDRAEDAKDVDGNVLRHDSGPLKGQVMHKGYDIRYKASQLNVKYDPSMPDRFGQLSYEYLGEVAPGLQHGEIDAGKAWVLHDIDDRVGGEDFELDRDNHGSSGGNIGFIDGRVEWQRADGWAAVIWAGHNERLEYTDPSVTVAQPVGERGEWDRASGWPYAGFVTVGSIRIGW